MPRPPVPTSARLARGWLVAHSLLAYVFLYAPIVVFVVYSFNAGSRTSRWEGFSLAWYAKLASNAALSDAAVNSLIVATCATAVSVVVGTLAAVGLDRFRFRGRGLTGGLLVLPVVLPEVVLAVSLVNFFRDAGVERASLWTVVPAHVAFTVSYVTVVVRARLAGMDRSAEEAARDLGAGPIGAFARVTLPALVPGIAAGAMLAFSLSLDDYVVTRQVSGPGSQTLPLEVYSMLRKAVTPEVNAACAVLLAATVVLAVAAQRMLARR